MSPLGALRRLWRALPVPGALRRKLGATIFALAQARQKEASVRPRAGWRIKKGPLILSGFIKDVMGLGRAARLTASALDAAGLPCLRHDLRPVLHFDPNIPYTEVPFPDAPGGGVLILHCNAPEATAFFNNIPARFWADRYRIGIWAWELEELPEDWRPVCRRFHEIWAPSRFVADAVRPHARSVKVMPHPLTDTAAAAPDRARFGFREGVFVFAAMADGRSTLTRKNPLGAVQAFRRAFPEPTQAASLVVKLVNPDADPAGLAPLKAAAEGRPDIILYTENLSDAEMLSFLASIDGLLALHRSEGFGLSMAEALSLAKPVIATGWSGNTDFMTGALVEGLVRYDLIPVNDLSGRYQGSRWADPDLDHAAELIRKLVRDPDFRRRLAEAGPAAAAELNAPWTRERLLGQAFTRYLRS